MQVLLDNDLWGTSLFKVSIDSAIEKAGKMVYSTDHYRQQQTKEERYSKLKKLRESAGLCLGCVRSGNIDANLPCNLNH